MERLRTCCLMFSLTITIALIGTQFVQAAENKTLHAAAMSILANELRSHAQVLADDTFEGREAGSRGGRAAAGYLVGHFEKAGLRGGANGGSFYQPFGNYRNLLGVLEGSDPELKNEFIIIGAHYDHVGYGTPRNSYGPTGYIHNGADDNASGTACLLEIVDAFKSLPTPPSRSILFALWDGEEQGLLGSKYWMSNPTVAREKIAFAFNMDMVGRLRSEKLEVYGSRTSYGLRRIFSRHNEAVGLELDFTWELQANSDHYTFASNGVPVLMPFTGLHEDYHRPSDDVEKLNASGIERIGRLMFFVTHEIASTRERFTFRSASRQETPATRQQFERVYPPPPPRLGVSWVVRENEPGVYLTNVEPQSPAGRAGLGIGDQLLKLNQLPIADEAELRMQLLATKNPATFTIRRSGTQESTEVAVELAGEPVRLGISWREDDAEPGMVLLTQVIPGSAAQQAGLREKDRIYEVAGQKFANGDEFRRLASSLPSPLDLLVERAGRYRRISMKVPPLNRD